MDPFDPIRPKIRGQEVSLNSSIPLFVPLLFGAGGLLFAWVTFYLLRQRKRWLRDAVVVPGRVIGLKSGARSLDQPTSYAPVVSFSSTTGEYTFTSSTFRSPCPYTVGQGVSVLSLPGEEPQLEEDVRSVLAPLMAALGAVGFIAATVLMLVLQSH